MNRLRKAGYARQASGWYVHEETGRQVHLDRYVYGELEWRYWARRGEIPHPHSKRGQFEREMLARHENGEV